MIEQVKHRAALRGFANEMIQAALDGCDMDGASIQETAVKHGLLAIKRMPAPCRGPAEHCRCAWSTDFPADCYQPTAAITDTDHHPGTTKNPGITKMVDAAMVEMEGGSPPLRRSECERLIRAALAATWVPTSA